MENSHNKDISGNGRNENQCCTRSSIPAKGYLCLAGAALIGGAALKCLGHKHMGLFVGQLAAPILLCGIYHKKIIPGEHQQTS